MSLFFDLFLHCVGVLVGSCLHPIAFPKWLHVLAQGTKGAEPWSWHPRREFYCLFCKCMERGTISAPFSHDMVLSAALPLLLDLRLLMADLFPLHLLCFAEGSGWFEQVQGA